MGGQISVEQEVLVITRKLVAELGQERAARSISLDASLEKDLGLGSLERVELLMRLEQELSISVPDHVVAEADTLRELIHAVRSADVHLGGAGLTTHTALAEAAFHPSGAATLGEVIRQYAENEPERPHIYLQHDDGGEETITYGDLFEAARVTAGGLWARRIKPGDTVAIMLPTSKDFFCAFLGVLLAGGIPVPIYPPYRADRLEEYAKRQAVILRNAQSSILITFQRVEGLAMLLRPFVPSLQEVTTVEKLTSTKTSAPDLIMRPEDPAMIQYTSGSTSDPKGVLLPHSSILANIRAIGVAAQIQPTDVGVSWLPLYHDMGLIGSWLCCLYYGLPITIMSPFAFLNRPERWLWAIHYHRGTLSAAPNFAYELCIKKIEDRAIEGLDLSSWRLAFNGAEPVNPDTIERFTKRFSPYGFKPETLFPVYGLAESSVALTFPPTGRAPRVDRIHRNTFQTNHRAQPASPSDTTALRFVSAGIPLPGHDVRIVNEKGEEVDERVEGVLQFRGPSCMKEYFRSQEATRSIDRAGWWDSGDLAYQAEGEIFITGRCKDVIIKAGRNLYPHEVEEVVGDLPGVRKGCVIACGVFDAGTGTEDLLVVAESREKKAQAKDEIRSAVIERVATTIGVPPDKVLLVPPGTIPKTSSGKLRRTACRDAYLQGRLVGRRIPVWLQAVKLFAAGLGPRLKQHAAALANRAYGLYAWLVVAITVPLAWIAGVLLPGPRAPAQVCRVWARLFLILLGCPLQVQGRSQAERGGSLVLVSNHTSYLDVAILMAALPPGFLFVAKKELEKMALTRTFIRKVGHLTVDRIDFSKSLSDTAEIETALKGGSSVLIFPEGTFTRATGLRPFRMGAFKVAAETGRPVVPIAICGSRQILWPESWWPRRGPIRVVIGEPIEPKGAELRDIIRLRDKARAEIARHCGEEIMDEAPPVPPQSG